MGGISYEDEDDGGWIWGVEGGLIFLLYFIEEWSTNIVSFHMQL